LQAAQNPNRTGISWKKFAEPGEKIANSGSHMEHSLPIPASRLRQGFFRAGNFLRGAWHYLRDGWLAIALFLGVGLGAQGFFWGTYDCLNLDRMALKNVVSRQRPLLHPGEFYKPPFYTYMNHFFARGPAQTFSSGLIWLKKSERFDFYLKLRLAMARFWNLVLFAGCVVLVYCLAREFYSVGAGRAAALLMATSAGFVPYQVFLTTDLAVIFMMLASFACAAFLTRNPSMRWSVAAGLLAGLAGATKYNGIMIAAALPVAHLLASRGNPVMACLKRPSAWVCGLMVPVGFFIGNPYALLDFPSFLSDFLYNYKVTPVYGGETAESGYGTYFRAFYEIFGQPGLFFILAGLGIGLVGVPLNWKKSSGGKLWLLAWVVAGVYSWKIGSFPRMETRFVLPAAPYVLLLGAAGFGVMLRARWLAAPILAGIVVFNLACGWWVGELFRRDPRNEVLAFARNQIPSGAVIEASVSIPRLGDLPDRDYVLHKIPSGVDRLKNFSDRFAEDEDVMRVVNKRKETSGRQWFSVEALQERNPDWIFWSTIDLEKSTRAFHETLLNGAAGYRIVWDGESPTLPAWVYPRNTEFLRNRTTIWAR